MPVLCVCVPKWLCCYLFPGGEGGEGGSIQHYLIWHSITSNSGLECLMKRESREFGRIFRTLFSCDRISNIAFIGFGVSSEEWHLIIYTCRRSQIVLANFWPSCPRYSWCLSVVTAVSTSIMSKGVLILGKKVLVTEAMMLCTVGHRYIACL